MGPIDQLIHTTVRIETEKATGVHAGTGFIMGFCDDGQSSVQCIVTNKHVIRGATQGRFVWTVAEDGLPVLGKKVTVVINDFERRWLLHPDPDIDLAILPIAAVAARAKEGGNQIYYRCFRMSDVADQAYLNGLCAIESIVMVGYPNGLWDELNNRPLVRQGITATPAYDDFNGQKMFVIDCACFGGSSGSPVLLYNQGTYPQKDGGMAMGSRIKLLGVLYEGPTINAEGGIVLKPVPTAKEVPVAVTQLMINLGHCVKASELKWFDDAISRMPEVSSPSDTAAE